MSELNKYYIPENVTSQNMYFEEYSLIDIPIGRGANTNKLIEDINGNNLTNYINAGETHVEHTKGFNKEKILLHTPQRYSILSSVAETKYNINWNEEAIIYYGVDMLTDIKISKEGIIDIPTGYTLYTVYLNNIELKKYKDYIIQNEKIFLTKLGMMEYNIINNSVTLIVYPTNQEDYVTAFANANANLSYWSVKKFFDKDTFLDETYMENNDKVINVVGYESLQYSEEHNIEYYGRTKRKRVLSSQFIGKITLEYYVGKDLESLFNKFYKKKFRIIINHPNTNTIEIFPNCEIIKNVNKTYSKEKNTESIEIITDGRYLIDYTNPNKLNLLGKPYNYGIYNNGIFG